MRISSRYIGVEQIEKAEATGFERVDVVDDFIYKGRVVLLPDEPKYIDSDIIKIGDTVLFAKYSPDTHEVEHEGKKYKFILATDILAVL